MTTPGTTEPTRWKPILITLGSGVILTLSSCAGMALGLKGDGGLVFLFALGAVAGTPVTIIGIVWVLGAGIHYLIGK